jgi:HEAT repeats
VNRRLIILTASLILLVGVAAYGKNRIGDIEFFGYTNFANPNQLRKKLPLHVGDKITDQMKAKVQQAIRLDTGQEPKSVAFICCDAHGNSTLFIGLPGPTTSNISYYAPPKGHERLPDNLKELYRRLNREWEAAVRKGGGAAEEDDSRGYALFKYPPAHALQIQLRKYALGHQTALLQVLSDSSDVEQRRMVAYVLGYAKQSQTQISALMRATRDPDSAVRNNAARALEVLARSDPRVAAQIPAHNFIAMVKSGVWTDRNKASFVLMALTQTRSPLLLAELRKEALPALIEMAKWHDAGHADPARIILGRIAGIPEEQLQREASQPTARPILEALGVQ